MEPGPPAMLFQITVRYGGRHQRYHTFTVEAPDAREAMQKGAAEIPDDIAPQADLVELRISVDPDSRPYPGGDG